ncbi:response regulator, partial [Sphingomonas sp. PsM26]|nr:response regulator [Sphingomonas sp. PsM26]
GYLITAVADGPAAINVLNGPSRIDLLFTDVVLTGPMNGREIAEYAQTARPSTPVLFTSGYAREAITHNARLGEGVILLSKPFNYIDLASAVRAAIDKANI